MNEGVSTIPAVTVRAFSGVRLGLPLETSRRLLLPPVRRSVKPVDETPDGWKRSLRLGALISTDEVPRKRIASLKCQSRPAFQDLTAPKDEYLVWRPARSVETSLASGKSLRSGMFTSSATSKTWLRASTGALVFCTQRTGAPPFARHIRRPVQLTKSVGRKLLSIT